MGGRIAVRTAIAELDTEITAFLANPTTVSAAEDLLAKVRLRDQAIRPYDEAVVKHLTDDTEITTEISRTMEYYDLMDKLKRDLRRCIDALAPVPAAATLTETIPAPQTPNPHSTLRLPVLDIETFQGNLSHFQGFWEQYETCIHKNQSLTDVIKFRYLKQLLRGSPLQLVNSLPVDADSYAQAIKLLT